MNKRILLAGFTFNFERPNVVRYVTSGICIVHCLKKFTFPILMFQGIRELDLLYISGLIFSPLCILLKVQPEGKL